MHRSINILAPAKINLFLHVVGRRDDGYHLLESLVGFADVGDLLTLSPGEGIALRTTGPFADALAAQGMADSTGPAMAQNLVVRAAEALRHLPGADARAGALIHVRKNLPVAAGIGGGSADAAAALLGLCALWDLDVPRETLDRIACDLGADVPMCLDGRAAMVGGIGESIAPIAGLGGTPLVLVNPGVPVSTAACFRGRQGPFSPAGETAAAFIRETDATDRRTAPRVLADALAGRRNDLAAPARLIEPLVDASLRALEAADGCLLARMSGSGATCFGLFADGDAADRAAAALTAAHPGWWVQATRLLEAPARPVVAPAGRDPAG